MIEIIRKTIERQPFGFGHEKGTDLVPGTVISFDVELTTRFGQSHEMVRLLKIAQRLYGAGVHRHVAKILYDSKSSTVSAEAPPGHDISDEDLAKIGKCFKAVCFHTYFTYQRTVEWQSDEDGTELDD